MVPELFVISSNSPDRDTIIKESEAKLAYPFLGSSREDVYEFFRKNIRPADDSTKVEPFTYFSFMVIDSDCANSTPYQCVVCSDAPDYDEPSGAIKLKATRVPIEEAALILNCMEQLYMTPSEASNPNSDSLFSIPPFTQKDDPNMCDDAETFVPATPAEARKNKERGIQAFVDRPIKDYPVALVPERRATLGKCPRGEARLSSSAHRYMECLSKTTGTILAYKSNPSEEVSEEVKKRAERTREQVEAVGRLTSA